MGAARRVRLAGFAAGAALRQLVLATRRQGWRGLRRPGERRDGRAHRRDHDRGGARVVEQLHPLATLPLRQGEVVEWGATRSNSSRSPSEQRPRQRAGARGERHPRRRDSRTARRSRRICSIGQSVGTPAVRTGLANDVYLTLEPGASGRRRPATIRVVRQADDPLAVDRRARDGDRHAARGVPRTRRRRAVDPVSAPIAVGARRSTTTANRSGRRRRMSDVRRRVPTTAATSAPGRAVDRARDRGRHGRAVRRAGRRRPGRARRRTSSPLLGRPAPEAVGRARRRHAFDLAQRKGSWVVLNFFTADCVPCIQEHPELVEFVEQQRRSGPTVPSSTRSSSTTARPTSRSSSPSAAATGRSSTRSRRSRRVRGRRSCPRRGSSTRAASCRVRLISRSTAEQLNVTMQQLPGGVRLMDARPRVEPRLKGWPGWVAAGVVVAGSSPSARPASTGPQTQEDRIDAITQRVACPVCDGESVFESRNNASRAIRNEVTDLVRGNELDRRRDRRVPRDRYGADVLLVPKASGSTRSSGCCRRSVRVRGRRAGRRRSGGGSARPTRPAHRPTTTERSSRRRARRAER